MADGRPGGRGHTITAMAKPMHVLLVDDHALFREGLALLLRQLNDAIAVHHAGSVAQALERAAELATLDLVLLDLNMPRLSGREAVAAVRQQLDHVPLVVLSGEEDPALVHWSIEAGAMGYVTKSSDHVEMARALEWVLEGRVYLPPFALASLAAGAGSAAGTPDPLAELTPRQRDVLRHLVQGKSNKVIARELGIADVTVKSHVTAVLQALGVSNRTQVVYTVARMGLSLGD